MGCVKFTAALVCMSAAVYGQIAPPKVSGFKTPIGIRISSEDPGNLFTLDLNGASIQPVSSTSLAWRIDGREITLSVRPRPWDLPDSAPDNTTLQTYLKAQNAAAAEEFECQSGRTCSIWKSAANGRPAWNAAAVNGKRIILLSATTASPAEDSAARAWLKNTMLTLRRGEAVAAPSAEPKPAEGGMSLPGQMRLREALLGQRQAAFLNRKLMTENDSKVPEAIPVSPAAIIEIAKFILRAEPEGGIVEASVFDGTLAHAVNIYDFDETKSVFKYWDPLGTTSFLAQGNNKAGIAAVRHPTEARMWLVPASDLERIFHSTVLPEWQVLAILRLATLLQGPEAAAVDTYRAIRLEKADDPEIAEARFAKAGEYLLAKKQYDAAFKIERIRVALYPEETASARTALASAGRSDLEQKLAQPFAAEKGAAPGRQELAEAMKTDFFSFFHLAQTEEQKRSEGGRTLKFRPTGAKFHELVEVTATEEPDGTIPAWSVMIAKSMIADPTNRIFASDIAKSFLSFAVPGAGQEAVGRMAREIWSRPTSAPREVQLPGAPEGVTVPAMPSLAYMTFVGAYPAYSVPLEGGRLRLDHVVAADGPSLRISVGP